MRCRSIGSRVLTRGRYSIRQTNFVLFVFTIVVTLIFLATGPTYYYDGGKEMQLFLESHPFSDWEENALSEAECKIPFFKPFEKEIWSYIRLPPKTIHCSQREVLLSKIHLKTHELEIFPEAKLYTCYVEELVRNTDDLVEYINSRPLAVGKHQLKSKPNLQALRVSCKNFLGFSVYSRIHLVFPFIEITKKHPKDAKNIFIFGIDSVSRLAAMRLLPKTYLYLVQNLSAVVLESHHKVGDNTFPNLITILTGAQRTHPASSAHKNDNPDEWPLIWRNFSDVGYETFYGEDFPKFATFNYLCKGFREPPTDHYLRPFWLAVDDSLVNKRSEPICYGNMPKHKMQLDYLKAFIQTERSHPYFVFSFLVEISHEYQEFVGAADDDIVEVLTLLKQQVLSGETVLFFLSDHGHRFDAIRQTPQGHVEERMPFVAIATADPKQKEMLQYNHNKLTSHYDLFESLRSFLPFGDRPEESAFGMNILEKRVPLDRTCAEAGVIDVYCSCKQARNDSGEVDDENKTKNLTVRAVQFINELLESEPMSKKVCAKLHLEKIISAFEMGSGNVLTLETRPGNAIFEIRFKNWTEPLQETQFSRINRYGTPCVPSQILRKYCFCGALS